jgi:hypothetical protein
MNHKKKFCFLELFGFYWKWRADRRCPSDWAPIPGAIGMALLNLDSGNRGEYSFNQGRVLGGLL